MITKAETVQIVADYANLGRLASAILSATGKDPHRPGTSWYYAEIMVLLRVISNTLTDRGTDTVRRRAEKILRDHLGRRAGQIYRAFDRAADLIDRTPRSADEIAVADERLEALVELAAR